MPCLSVNLFIMKRQDSAETIKIFDETAVVGVQEFASPTTVWLVPNFARWADLVSGSEVPAEQREAIDNELDEVTDYVFEVLQNSNFQPRSA